MLGVVYHQPNIKNLILDPRIFRVLRVLCGKKNGTPVGIAFPMKRRFIFQALLRFCYFAKLNIRITLVVELQREEGFSSHIN
jgi:hypothetical protein